MKYSLLLVALFPLGQSFAGSLEATSVANSSACSSSVPFYWEIGNSTAILVSGSVGKMTRTQKLSIASASKWPYGAYVNEVKKGNLSVEDIKYLNLKSGWSRFSKCEPADTVGSCAAGAGYVRRNDGKFNYGGGHFQEHAFLNGLGPLNSTTLATKINGVLGTSFEYSSPQLAGGIRTTTAAYVGMLQKIMSLKLADGVYLAANQTSTQGFGTSSPIPEAWFYGRGHWIELDGTYSSPGAFGFYPWISADKKLYGVVAAQNMGSAWTSVKCGRAIRQAYLK